MGGEREDALLRHYKTIHLNLRNDEPVPRLIRESLEEYRIALQVAALNGTTPDVSHLNIPSRLPSPVNAPSPTLSTGSSGSGLGLGSGSPYSPAVSCCSSVGPSTPVEDPLYEWASSSPYSPNSPNSFSHSPVEKTTSSDWSLSFNFDFDFDFDVTAYLPQPQSQPELYTAITPTSTPDQEYDSSFLFDSTHSFGVPSLYDFSAIPLVNIDDFNVNVNEKETESLGLGLTELLNSPLDLDFDFSQTSSIGL